jgi:peptidoglycan/LPS O-acetylase OafA/YrhL
MSQNIQPQRYSELDSLRGLAALMVVIFHYTVERPTANSLFRLGSTGVDLFFIISGFVIFMSISKVKNSLDFVINRTTRLYPTYWASVTFSFIILTLISIFKNDSNFHIEWLRYLGNMTMFQFYLKVQNLEGAYWTMIIEMIFYGAILLLYYFKGLKHLNKFGIFLSLIVVVMIHLKGSYQTLIITVIQSVPLLQFTPLFLAGTVFYKIHTFKNNLIEYYSILILCLICQISLFGYTGWTYCFIDQKRYAFMLIAYFSLFTLFVNNKLGFIVSKPSLFLGKISFALYLIHQTISVDVIIPFLTNRLHINFWIASMLITLPIVISLAALITFYIEIPLSKRMKDTLKKFN